jgi:hypothetical protein
MSIGTVMLAAQMSALQRGRSHRGGRGGRDAAMAGRAVRQARAEGGQCLAGRQRADDRAGLVGGRCPVASELVRQDEARRHAPHKDQRKDLDPLAEQVHVDLAARLEPKSLQHRQPTGQSDGWEQQVETDGEGELDARQQQGVGQIKHLGSLESFGAPVV